VVVVVMVEPSDDEDENYYGWGHQDPVAWVQKLIGEQILVCCLSS